MTAERPVTDADLDAYFADHPELVDGPVRPVQPICGTLGAAAGARSVADTEKAQDGRTTAEWVAHLVKARQVAEAERDEARADADSLGDALVREVETVARVKEVIAGWWPVNLPDFGSADARDEIRAALADPEPAQVQQADEEAS